MKKSKKYFVIVSCILIVIVCGVILNKVIKVINDIDSDEIKVLRMGLIPADDAAEMLKNYEPVREYLSQELGIPVEIEVTSDYTAAINAMKYGHIDIAWFGPFSYIIAANVADAEAIVNGIKDNGKSTYKSIIVANVNSGIETLEDLKGKSFAFVDPASTSGNLIPRKMLIENGIDPDNDFSESFFAGTHNAVQYAIANGNVDAGADSDNSYYRMLAAGEIDAEVNLIIYESEPIPGSPIVVRGGLSEDIKVAIQNALVNMDEQTIHKVDGWGGIVKYQVVNDSDYDIIRETAEILNMSVPAM